MPSKGRDEPAIIAQTYHLLASDEYRLNIHTSTDATASVSPLTSCIQSETPHYEYFF